MSGENRVLHKRYKAKGVCTSYIDITAEGGIVSEVVFVGGCQGNTGGISSLVKGMAVDEVIARLEGITCEEKRTSCPDQLARALKEMQNENN